ncbi:hypothetical protein [Stieleria neptunia]|nr:hypothetical protein [Stieleria neptunia]
MTDENWTDAASALCRAAMTFETMLVSCLEKHPERFRELIAPYQEEFQTHSAVVTHWRHLLEISEGLGAEAE